MEDYAFVVRRDQTCVGKISFTIDRVQLDGVLIGVIIVSYASKNITEVERRYAQTKKGAASSLNMRKV